MAAKLTSLTHKTTI